MKLLQGLSISAAWLLASSAAWAEGMQSQAAYPFSFAPQQGQQVSVTLSGNQASVQLPSGETQTLGEIEPEEGNTAAVAEVADFNFDGAQDVALVDSHGYAGALTNYRLFLWNAADGKFQPFEPEIPLSDLGLNESEQFFSADEKDGAFHIQRFYRSEKGIPYVAVELTPIALEGGWILRVYKDSKGKVTGHKIIDPSNEHAGLAEDVPPAVAKIQTDKAWLYDSLDEASKTKMYLIKGDSVSLLDFDGNPSVGEGKFLVRYQGRKVIEKWVDASAIAPE